jgi:hypothetical protein
MGKLLTDLGFENALDQQKMNKESFLENWARVVDDPAVQGSPSERQELIEVYEAP